MSQEFTFKCLMCEQTFTALNDSPIDHRAAYARRALRATKSEGRDESR